MSRKRDSVPSPRTWTPPASTMRCLRTTAGALPDSGRLDGAIALGGSLGVYDPRLLETRRWIRNAVLSGLPFLGICLGGQLLASALGARVARGRPELGLHDIFLTDAAERDPLFAGLPGRLQVFGWHEDAFDLAPGAVPLAGSISCTYQAFRFDAAAYGLQFHPEVRVDDLFRWRGVAGYRTSPSGPAATSTRWRSDYSARRRHSARSPSNCSSVGCTWRRASPRSARRRARRRDRAPERDRRPSRQRRLPP
jgi:GMP synthase (glutamine-hydrolysing)